MTNSVWTMLTWYLRVTYEIKKKKRKRNKNHINHSLHVIAYNGIPSSRELKRRKIVRGDKFSIFYQDNFDNRNHSWMMQSFRKELIQYPWISFNLESLERKGRRINPFSLTNFPRIASGCFFQPWKRVTVWSNLDWKRDWRIEEREKSERTIRLAW